MSRKNTNEERIRRLDPDHFTYLHEEEIRAAMKRHASHCTFSIDRMDEQRKKRSRLLQRRGLAVSTANHRNFSSLDNDRRSLACPMSSSVLERGHLACSCRFFSSGALRPISSPLPMSAGACRLAS